MLLLNKYDMQDVADYLRTTRYRYLIADYIKYLDAVSYRYHFATIIGEFDDWDYYFNRDFEHQKAWDAIYDEGNLEKDEFLFDGSLTTEEFLPCLELAEF